MTQLPVEVLSQDDVRRLIADPDADDIFGLRDAAILSVLYYAAATAGEIENVPEVKAGQRSANSTVIRSPG